MGVINFYRLYIHYKKLCRISTSIMKHMRKLDGNLDVFLIWLRLSDVHVC